MTLKIRRNSNYSLSGSDPEKPDTGSEHYQHSKARNFAVRYFKLRANVPDGILIEAVRTKHRSARNLKDDQVLTWFFQFKSPDGFNEMFNN